MKSSKWKQIRYRKLRSVNFKCEWCGEGENLQVHHKHYKTLGNERNKDLTVVCGGCHWIADKVRAKKDTKLEKKYRKKRMKTKAEKSRDHALRQLPDPMKYGETTKTPKGRRLAK